jgi:hypothetical protein
MTPKESPAAALAQFQRRGETPLPAGAWTGWSHTSMPPRPKCLSPLTIMHLLRVIVHDVCSEKAGSQGRGDGALPSSGSDEGRSGQPRSSGVEMRGLVRSPVVSSRGEPFDFAPFGPAQGKQGKLRRTTCAEHRRSMPGCFPPPGSRQSCLDVSAPGEGKPSSPGEEGLRSGPWLPVLSRMVRVPFS